VNDIAGEHLVDFMNANGLTVCNREGAPTRQVRDSESHIDVTIASIRLASKITKWRILDEESLSDHNYINFSAEDTGVTEEANHVTRNIWHLNIEALRDATRKCNTTMGEEDTDTDTDTVSECAETLQNMMTGVLEKVAPESSIKNRRSVHRWTREIEELRKTSNRTRPVYQRKRKRAGLDMCTIEKTACKEAKLALTKAIKISKEKS